MRLDANAYTVSVSNSSKPPARHAGHDDYDLGHADAAVSYCRSKVCVVTCGRSCCPTWSRGVNLPKNPFSFPLCSWLRAHPCAGTDARQRTCESSRRRSPVHHLWRFPSHVKPKGRKVEVDPTSADSCRIEMSHRRGYASSGASCRLTFRQGPPKCTRSSPPQTSRQTPHQPARPETSR